MRVPFQPDRAAIARGETSPSRRLDPAPAPSTRGATPVNRSHPEQPVGRVVRPRPRDLEVKTTASTADRTRPRRVLREAHLRSLRVNERRREVTSCERQRFAQKRRQRGIVGATKDILPSASAWIRRAGPPLSSSDVRPSRTRSRGRGERGQSARRCSTAWYVDTRSFRASQRREPREEHAIRCVAR